MFRQIVSDGTPFVIAEVGQNHQGDLDVAREYIRILAFEGADAIKFQTRKNGYLFSKDAYEMAFLEGQRAVLLFIKSMLKPIPKEKK